MHTIDKLIFQGRAGTALTAIGRDFDALLPLLGYNLHLIGVLTAANLPAALLVLEQCLQARDRQWFHPQLLARVEGSWTEIHSVAPLLRHLDLVAFPLDADFPRWAALRPPEAVLLFHRHYQDLGELLRDPLLPQALAAFPRSLAMVRLAFLPAASLAENNPLPRDLRDRLLILDRQQAFYWNGESLAADPSLEADGAGTVVATLDGDLLHCRRGGRTRTWPCHDASWREPLVRFLEGDS